MKCISSEVAKNQIFNLSSDILMSDLVKNISEFLGVKNPQIKLPLSMVNFFLYLFEGRIRTPLTRSRVNALINKTSYSTEKLQKLLGFKLTKPMPFGALDVLASRQDLNQFSRK